MNIKMNIKRSQIISKSFIAVGIICMIFIIGGCNQEQKVVKKKKSITVKAVIAKEMQLSETLKTTGDVVATNTVTLRAAVEGPIKYCPWREGDIVENIGQKIIEISRPLYQHQLDVARAELDVKKAILKDLKIGPRPEEIVIAKENVINLTSCTDFAKIDLERLSSLVKKNIISKQDEEKARVNYVKCQTQLESSKETLMMLEEGTKITELAIADAIVKKANASLELAQTKINECTINAPFSGIVTQVFVRPGDLTHLSSPRMPLVKIMDPKSLIIRAGLPENCSSQITLGIDVQVELDAYPDKKFSGKIERIYPRIEQNSRTRIIEVRIKDEVKLLPRMFARITLQGRSVKNAIVVPDSAIITTPRGGHIVFIVKDGKAIMRHVEIGLENGNDIQIVKGINVDDTVIIAGNFNLKNGLSVKIIKTTAL